MAEKKIRAIIIVEVVGRPAEHVKESLKQHVSNIDKDKKAKLISLTLSEPKKIEMPEAQAQEMFTCFAEAEIEAESMGKLAELVFDYMPSSIEIIEPSEIIFSLSDATSFLNDLSGRLHRYDEIAKIAQMQTQQLSTRLQLAQEIIKNDPDLRKKFGVPDEKKVEEKAEKKVVKKSGKKAKKKK